MHRNIHRMVEWQILQNTVSNIIPHIGESHCLSFSHQTLSISSQLIKIQPVLITGGKAWHFANNNNIG